MADRWRDMVDVIRFAADAFKSACSAVLDDHAGPSACPAERIVIAPIDAAL